MHSTEAAFCGFHGVHATPQRQPRWSPAYEPINIGTKPMANSNKKDAAWHSNYRIELLICVGIAGAMSATFNVYGALITYAGVIGVVYSVIMLALEGIALCALHRMLTDWGNNHKLKALVTAVIFAAASCLCAMSGKRAFSALTTDTQSSVTSELANASRLDARAETQWNLAANEPNAAKKGYLEKRGDQYKREADQARADQAKRKPMANIEQWILLITLEVIKAFGIWSLAVKTRYRMTAKEIAAREETRRSNASAKRKQTTAQHLVEPEAVTAARQKAAKECTVARPRFGATVTE